MKDNNIKNTEIQELQLIRDLDREAFEKSIKHWDMIAKPLNSLGLFEKAVTKIAGISGCFENLKLDKKALVVMCSDNGVVKEKISQTDQEVTAEVSENFTKKETSSAVMSQGLNVDLYPIDLGIYRDIDNSYKSEDKKLEPFKITDRKISYGTKNIAEEPAMTRKEALEAIKTGMNAVKELKEKGYKIIATGEMGIGNTTTSSAAASVLLGKNPEEVTGRGAGLTTEMLKHKIEIIKKAIEINKPDASDPIDIVSKVGGYDIAAMMGMFIGAAVYRIPVVIDGVISAVSALAAVRLEPIVQKFILPSHVSNEPAGKMLMEALDLEPFITAHMCLGEGTGALMLFPMLDAALNVYNDMKTFENVGIKQYEHLK